MENITPSQQKDLIEDHDRESGSVGVSNHKLDLNYVQFQDLQKPQEVDKRIFLPLYASTACVILFTGLLPTALVVILVTVWAFIFLGTPIYYLYHYHPDSVACFQDNTKPGSDIADFEMPRRTASA